MRKYVFLVDWDVETPSPESITIPEPPESRRTSWGCEAQKKIRRLRPELQQDWKFLIRRDCGRNCNQRNVFYKSQQLRLSAWRISHEKNIYITSKKKNLRWVTSWCPEISGQIQFSKIPRQSSRSAKSRISWISSSVKIFVSRWLRISNYPSHGVWGILTNKIT